jgi:hypothetical protein
VNHQVVGRDTGSSVVTARRTRLRASHRLPAFAAVVLVLEAIVVLLQPARSLTPFLLVPVPAVAAVLVSAASGGRGEVRGLISRMSVWRVRPLWYLAALASYPGHLRWLPNHSVSFAYAADAAAGL